MATLFHNISGELTKELLAAGDGVRVSQISITNTNDDAKFCSLDLYIEKKLLGKFHLVKNVKLATGTTFIYDNLAANKRRTISTTPAAIKNPDPSSVYTFS